jgi:hypothetical protein
MTMTREEIDLRERISSEISAFIETQDLTEEAYWGLSRAIGVVRERINHKPTCPCSRCGGQS